MKIHSEIPMRQDTAKQYKQIRKILQSGRSEPLPDDDTAWMDESRTFNAGMVIICLVLGFAMCLIASCAHAEMIAGYDVQVWANAIKKAENSTSHPYGIMATFKHTSPRQACINTVRHKHRLWCKNSCGKPFISYLASKYAPIGASNDPNGLNRHWVKNVQHFLDKEIA
jgi:hypothetical protein